jgi:protein involved in polysaccharide export with SLBB domain
MKRIVCYLIIIACGISSALSQPNNPYQRNAKTARLNPMDSLKLSKDASKSSASFGLIEKPIDPKSYIVGPGDVFQLTVINASNIDKAIVISPDGRAVIPDAGVVDLKNKTLEQAEKIILDKVKKVYRSEDVYLTLKDIRKFKVSVSGSVMKPSSVPVTAVDRVSEAIENAGGLSQDASLRRIFLKRDGNIKRVDLQKYYYDGDVESNPTLQGGDNIIVNPYTTVDAIRIEGEVGAPGVYEYCDGDSLSHLVGFGKGFLKSAFLDSVEYVSYNQASDKFSTKFLNLSSWVQSYSNGSKPENDFILNPGDRVYVRKKKDWPVDKFVVLTGEVKYPGKYPINEGESRVKDLIDRAGGVTPQAAIDNALMIRRQAIEKEDQEMKRLSAIPPSEMSANERKYFQARVSEIKGVMSINFEKALKEPNGQDNILLMNKDSLIIPTLNKFISVQGRVNNPGSVAFNPEYTYEKYIELAGGLGFRADEDEILVVKSKGQQFSARDKKYELEPGDYILVPPQSETTFFDIFSSALTITTQLMTILGVVITIVRLK